MEAGEAIERLRVCSRPLKARPALRRPLLRPLPGVRAVLFDIYGTLFISASGEVGSRRGRAAALRRAFSACGLPLPPAGSRRAARLLPELILAEHREQRAKGYEFPEVEIRLVFRRLVERLRGKGMAPLPEAVDEERLSLEYELTVNPAWPMPGAGSTLQALKERGYRLGLLSNAQFYTPFLFPALLGYRLEELGFESRLCAWSYRSRQAKPSLALFEEVTEALEGEGIRPADTLAVGNDRLNDVWPASRLGLRTALFAGDRRSYRPRPTDPRLAGLSPDLVLTSLAQLLEALS
jgi:putative hydrolase of the HAD superfamily